MLLLVALPRPARAATPAVPAANRVVVVSPVVVDRTLAAGRPTSFVIDVDNRTGATQHLTVGMADVASGRTPTEDKQVLEPGQHAARGAASWLHVAPADRDFILADGATRHLHVVATAPADAAPGGHYASVLVRIEPGQGGNVHIRAQVGVLVLLTAPGGVRHDLTAEVDVHPGLAILHRPGAVLRLRNRGNVHESVAGRIRVGGILSADRSSVVRPLVVLPGTVREVPISMPSRFAPDMLVARFQPAGPGRAPAASGRTLVLPWWLLAVLVAACAVVTWRLRSRRRSWPAQWDGDDDELTGIDDGA